VNYLRIFQILVNQNTKTMLHLRSVVEIVQVGIQMLYLPRTRETGPTGIAYNHGLSYPAGKSKSLK